MKLSFQCVFNIKLQLIVIALVIIFHFIDSAVWELEIYHQRCLRLQHIIELSNSNAEISEYFDFTVGHNFRIDLYNSGSIAWERIKFLNQALKSFRFYLSIVCLEIILISLFLKQYWMSIITFVLTVIYSQLTLSGYVLVIVINIFLIVTYGKLIKNERMSYFGFMQGCINTKRLVWPILLVSALIHCSLIILSNFESVIQQRLEAAVIERREKVCLSYKSQQKNIDKLSSEIEFRILRVASEQLGVDLEKISINSCIVEDLGADDNDIADFKYALEEEFKIAITDADFEKIHTLVDVSNHVIEHEPLSQSSSSSIGSETER
jgi:acyl carrier protein